MPKQCGFWLRLHYCTLNIYIFYQISADTVGGITHVCLTDLIMAQFAHLQCHTSNHSCDPHRTNITNSIFITGSIAEGTSLKEIKFSRTPGILKTPDTDIMVVLYQLYGSWENRYIKNIEGKPGFVNIDVTSASDEEVFQINVISKNGTKWVSAEYARSWVERQMEKTFPDQMKRDTFLNTIRRAGTRYTDREDTVRTAALEELSYKHPFVGSTSGIPKAVSSTHSGDGNERVLGSPSYSFGPTKGVEKHPLPESVPKDRKSDMDAIPAIFCKQWPKCADSWVRRALKRFDASIVYKIVCTGYQLVPKCSLDGDVTTEWRLSFSLAEHLLIHDWTVRQSQCFNVGKIILSFYLDAPADVITTYHLKTVMLWACEQKSAEQWEKCSLAQGLLGVFDDLIHALVSGMLPHYFIEGLNLLKYCSDNSIGQALKLVAMARRKIVDICKSIQTVNANEHLYTKNTDIAKCLRSHLMSTTIRCLRSNKPLHDGFTPSMENVKSNLTIIAQVASLYIAYMALLRKMTVRAMRKGETLINAYLNASQWYLDALAHCLSVEITNGGTLSFTLKELFSMDFNQASTHNRGRKKLSSRRHDIEHAFALRLMHEVTNLMNIQLLDGDELFSYYFKRITGEWLPELEAHANSSRRWVKLSETMRADERCVLTTPLLYTQALENDFEKYTSNEKHQKNKCWEHWYPILGQFIDKALDLVSADNLLKNSMIRNLSSQGFRIGGLRIPEELRVQIMSTTLPEETKNKLLDFYFNVSHDSESRRKMFIKWCVDICAGRKL